MYLPITFLETYISTKINKLLSTYTPIYSSEINRFKLEDFHFRIFISEE